MLRRPDDPREPLLARRFFNRPMKVGYALVLAAVAAIVWSSFFMPVGDGRATIRVVAGALMLLGVLCYGGGRILMLVQRRDEAAKRR